MLQFRNHPDKRARADLEAHGIRFQYYVPNYAWLVSLPSDLSPHLLEDSGIRWAGEWVPFDKLSGYIRDEDPPWWAVLPDGRWAVTVRFFKDVGAQEARETLARNEAVLLDEIRQLNAVIASIQPNRIDSLAGEQAILWLDFAPPPLGPVNDGSRAPALSR